MTYYIINYIPALLPTLAPDHNLDKNQTILIYFPKISGLLSIAQLFVPFSSLTQICGENNLK